MYVGIQERVSVSRATCAGNPWCNRSGWCLVRALRRIKHGRLVRLSDACVCQRRGVGIGDVTRAQTGWGVQCGHFAILRSIGVQRARLWRMSGVPFGESPCVSQYLAYKGIYHPFQASHLIEFDGGTTFLAVWHKRASF